MNGRGGAGKERKMIEKNIKNIKNIKMQNIEYQNLISKYKILKIYI